MLQGLNEAEKNPLLTKSYTYPAPGPAQDSE